MNLCAPTALTSKLETCDHLISKNKCTGSLAAGPMIPHEHRGCKGGRWEAGHLAALLTSHTCTTDHSTKHSKRFCHRTGLGQRPPAHYTRPR
eukprot:g1856.t1